LLATSFIGVLANCFDNETYAGAIGQSRLPVGLENAVLERGLDDIDHERT